MQRQQKDHFSRRGLAHRSPIVFRNITTVEQRYHHYRRSHAVTVLDKGPQSSQDVHSTSQHFSEYTCWRLFLLLID